MLLTSINNRILTIDDNNNYTYYDFDNDIRGIAHFNGKIYVAMVLEKLDFLSKDFLHYDILVLDYSFNFLKKLNTPIELLDIHEMVIYDNKLWITSTGDDKIVIYDLNVRSWRQWYPLGKTDEIYSAAQNRMLDHHHFNSIYFDNNKIYILAHNLDYDNSKIYVFNTKYELIDQIYLGKHAHNIWKKDNEILVNDSENGRIIGADGFEFKIQEEHMFLRGMTRDKDNNIYIGASTFEAREMRDISINLIYKFNSKYELTNIIHTNERAQIFNLDYI